MLLLSIKPEEKNVALLWNAKGIAFILPRTPDASFMERLHLMLLFVYFQAHNPQPGMETGILLIHWI